MAWEDKEIVEIVDDKDIKATEEEPITEEETNLVGLGMMPERAHQFYRRFPFGKIFVNGQVTPQFIEWWLEVADNDELNAIKGAELPNDLQMKVLEKQQEGALKISETPLQQYIDKNSELMARNKFLEDESLELKKSVKLYDDLGRKYFLFTKFLYELMGTKMEFKASIEIDNEELGKIEEIERGLNKK